MALRLPSLMVLVCAGALGAQVQPLGWIGDDGFDIACCSPVASDNVPPFPPFQMDGRYASIVDCDLEAEYDVRVSTWHIAIACDLALIPFTVTPASAGAPGWSGLMIGKYARTWVELDPRGFEVQIWRWLVNTDAAPAAGNTPSPIPPHPPGFDTHFTGHIDYACSLDALGNPEFRMAMNLNHLPGCISHGVFSAQPLLAPPFVDGHHERSYHLAAPATFVFAPVPPPVGPTRAEAVRSTLLPPLPYTCLGEATARGGAIDPVGANCLCPDAPAGGAFSWRHEFLSGTVLCLPGAPPVPYFSVSIASPAPPLPTGFVGLPIGFWSGVDPFPGTRDVAIYFGVMQYDDPCEPNGFPLHLVTGLSTTGPPGFTFNDPADLNFPPPYPVFLDLQDMVLATGLVGPYSLGYGTRFLSRVVWNLNLF